VPGFGFAIGMERLVMLVKGQRQEAEGMGQGLVFMAMLGEKAEKAAIPLMKTLRSNGIRLERDYGSKSIRSQMRRADKLGAKIVLILGDDELASHSITVKDMESGEQEKVPFEKVEEKIRALLTERQKVMSKQ